MSNYLKDHFIPFHTIGNKELEEINDELKAIVSEVEKIHGYDNYLRLKYTLRYDGMGIVRHDFEEIKNCFNRSRKVERLIFDVIDPKNLFDNKGKRIQLWFELLDPGRCQLLVTDDDEKWVDNIFKRLSTRLSHYKNHNGILRHSLAELFIQLLGVTAGFSICLIFASLLSPHIKVQHTFWAYWTNGSRYSYNRHYYTIVWLGMENIRESKFHRSQVITF